MTRNSSNVSAWVLMPYPKADALYPPSSASVTSKMISELMLERYSLATLLTRLRVLFLLCVIAEKAYPISQ